MVHALQLVKTWLNPEGSVLVIHDLVDPPRISVHGKNQQYYAGQLFSDNGFENQRQADLAVDQVVQEESFSVSKFRVFENDLRANSLAALLDWLDDQWESAYLTDGTLDMIGELEKQLGSGAEIVLHMISRIVQLDPE
jgi:hypothetical protein